MSGPAILSESSSAPATRSGDLLMCPLGLSGEYAASPYKGIASRNPGNSSMIDP